jgi:hypothetical protein
VEDLWVVWIAAYAATTCRTPAPATIDSTMAGEAAADYGMLVKNHQIISAW